MFEKKQIWLIYLLLAAAVIVAFRQVGRCDFINYDDPDYITKNVHVQHGITMESIWWAFTTANAGNWHPLTWVSHMLDVQVFGLNPHLHHLVNLLFHVASTLLLFFVFHRMTRAPWKSAFVAALFGLHPLHVESVAWVAERKDVLSTFFWMLTMAAYVRYAGNPRLKSYLAVLIFFALGLMSKPMLVTLPFVLLLLDYWPLGRMQGAGSTKRRALETVAGSREQGAGSGEALSANKKKGKSGKKPAPGSGPGRTSRGVALEGNRADRKYQWALIGPLFREKIPLFALAALSSVVTFIVQQKGGAVASFEGFTLNVRITNAFVSYIIYIAKTIWPDKLAVYYPHPGSWPLWQVMGAVFLFTAVTVMVIRTAKRFPYLAVGWLWYAGTLVPVIGIVQVGSQAMADRYTYIPLIGLFIVAAWGIPELTARRRYGREALSVLSASILICLFSLTWTQAGYWTNSLTLYDHDLKATRPNVHVLCNRGSAYEELGDHLAAISDYSRAIELNPGCAVAYYNRGLANCKLGDFRQAISDYGKAIEINPEHSAAYFNMGVAYEELGNNGQAISNYGRAIEFNPRYEDARYNRGAAYYRLGDYRQAISDYNSVIETNPNRAEAYNNRGAAYEALGNIMEAISNFNRAIEINPGCADAYYNRGLAYEELDNDRQAISDYGKAIQINPDYGDAYNGRGIAYRKLGDQRRAIEDLKTAARLNNEDAKNVLQSQGINW